MKEMKELMKAVGALAGEVHEVTKDGLGYEDLMSLVDMANDFKIYRDGLEGLGEIREELKKIKPEDAMVLMSELIAGFEQGKK